MGTPHPSIFLYPLEDLFAIQCIIISSVYHFQINLQLISMDHLSIIRQLNVFLPENEALRLAKYLKEDVLDAVAPTISIDEAMQALKEGMPYQYVVNRADFYGYSFYVDHRVLIPRPETEELVYRAIQWIKGSMIETPRVLDIGAGSGCIPITMKKEIPAIEMTSVDISKKALEVAIRNAEVLEVDVRFQHLDILSQDIDQLDTYDLIISNPPYIPTQELSKMGDSVLQYEPHEALFTTDQDGLVFYQRIADICDHLLREGGALFLELNEYHSESIKKIYSSFDHVNLLQDMQGKPRILYAH